jgi:hypothetical protein
MDKIRTQIFYFLIKIFVENNSTLKIALIKKNYKMIQINRRIKKRRRIKKVIQLNQKSYKAHCNNNFSRFKSFRQN